MLRAPPPWLELVGLRAEEARDSCICGARQRNISVGTSSRAAVFPVAVGEDVFLFLSQSSGRRGPLVDQCGSGEAIGECD